MQVQAGWAKGLQLSSPKGDQTRPTGAKIRAAIFDMLRFRLDLDRVLDLYAGSGAMGLEALSQGASHAVFVDQAAAAVQSLKKNLASLQLLADRTGQQYTATISRQDVPTFLSKPIGDETFNFIWADPPYAAVLDVLPKLLQFAAEALALGGVFILESAAKDTEKIAQIQADFTALGVVKQKRYGDTLITMYERPSE